MLALTAVFATGCTEQPATFEREETITTRAIVRSVDPEENRLVVYSGGRILTLKVREDFSDLSNIRAGDRIQADYHTILTVSVSDEVMSDAKSGRVFRVGETAADQTVVGRVETVRVVAEFTHYDVRTRLVTMRRNNGTFFTFRLPEQLRHVVTRMRPGERLLFQRHRAISISMDRREA